MRCDVVQPGRQGSADVQLVRAPMRGEGGVQAVGHQFGGADSLRPFQGFFGELDGAPRMAGVGPTSGESRPEPGPRAVVGGAGQHVVQLCGQPPWLGAEQIDRGGAEHRLRPPVEVILASATGRGVVVKSGGEVSPTRGAGRVGAVEKIAHGW